MEPDCLASRIRALAPLPPPLVVVERAVLEKAVKVCNRLASDWCCDSSDAGHHEEKFGVGQVVAALKEVLR